MTRKISLENVDMAIRDLVSWQTERRECSIPVDLSLKPAGDLGPMWICVQNSICESMSPYDSRSRSLGLDPEIHFLCSPSMCGGHDML